MGREIRRVPPNWEHPKYKEDELQYDWTTDDYKPMYDKSFNDVCKKWHEDYKNWYEGGVREQKAEFYGEDCEFWEYDTPPNRDSYRPDFTEEPTWYQVYETVSEGTPVTPPFATEDELIEYLCTHGDFWHQKHPDWGSSPKPTKEQATAFVKSGWAPSMVVIHHSGTGKPEILSNYEAAKLGGGND